MTKLHTDSFFTVGQKHLVDGKPCQDYVMSGEYDEGKLAFAVVSDGCSTGRNTDVGARLLVLSTIETLKEYWRTTKVVSLAMATWINVERSCRIRTIAPSLGVIHKDMLATSIIACFAQSEGFVHIHGDGVVAVKYRNGRIAMNKFEWPLNMPFYPAYEYENFSGFIAAHGGDMNAEVVHEERWIMCEDHSFIREEDVCHSIAEGVQGIYLPFSIGDDVEYVAIFSDGVTQVDNMDWKEAVSLFLRFKSTAGEFAKRRMIAGIKETMKIGKGPVDDISYAVIHLESDEVKGGVP